MNFPIITSSVASNENVIYRFRGKVTLSDNSDVTLRLFADSRYKLYVNGVYVYEGPISATENYYDEFSTDAFTVGENEVEAEVLYAGGTMTMSGIKRGRCVAFSLSVMQNGETVAETDENWEVGLDRSREFYRYRMVHPNGYANEKYEKKPVVFEKAKRYSSAWQKNNYWGVFGFYPTIKKSPIPFHTPEGKYGFTVSKSMTSGLAEDEAFSSLTVPAGETRDVVLSAGVHSVAYPTFAFEGKGKVTVVYAEGYRKLSPDGNYYVKYDRADKTGDILDDPTDIITLDGGEFTFVPYLHRVFRFVRITVEAVEEVTVKNASFALYRYPLREENDFTCSDETYNKIYEMSKRTLRNCMIDTYVDCPFYEMVQYVQDSYIQMAYTMMLSSDYTMPKKLMTDTWQTRGYDGMMQAGAPMTYHMVTPTNCIYFLAMAEDYLLYTGDREFVRPFLPAFFDVIDWYDKRLDEDGVVAPFPYGFYIDWVDDWTRDGDSNWYPPNAPKTACSIYSLTYLYALKLAAPLFRMYGNEGMATDMEKKYEALRENINRVFFDKSRMLYKDSKTGSYSEHSQIFAALSGAISGEEGKEMYKHLADEDVCKASFGYRYFKNRAADALGLPLDMEEFLTDWYDMLKDNATTFFEFPGQTRSDCHGWSATPIYEFTTKILGLTPVAEGATAVTVEPHFYHLTEASGTLPTMHGGVHLAFKKNADGYRVVVDSPRAIEKRIRLADGSIWKTNDEHIEYTL